MGLTSLTQPRVPAWLCRPGEFLLLFIAFSGRFYPGLLKLLGSHRPSFRILGSLELCPGTDCSFLISYCLGPCVPWSLVLEREDPGG